MKNINRVTFFNFLSILLLQGISFVSAPIFSRLLGTDGYGNLGSFITWANVAGTVLSLQTNITLVNARVEFPEGEQSAYQSSVMSLSVLAYAVGGVAMAVLAGPISAGLKLEKFMLAVLLLQSFGTFCVNFLSSKFTYEFKADRNMCLSVAMAVSTMGFALLLVMNLPMEQRYFGRVLGNALVYGVVGIAACCWILHRGKVFYNRKYWKFCILLSWPMVWQNLSYQILGSSDILMLKQMTDAAQSGIYYLAYTIGGFIFTIFDALNRSWVPFFFDDMKEGRRENVQSQANHFLELFTVLAIGFVLLMPEVYHIYAGKTYWGGLGLIPIFVGSYYVNFLCTFPVNYAYFRKKTGVVASATVSAALINVVLNYVFIKSYGIFGAAWATLLSHVLQLAMHECYIRLGSGKEGYPFRFFNAARYAALFGAAVLLFYLTPDAWLVRWVLGAAIGIFELVRIWKRKSLL